MAAPAITNESVLEFTQNNTKELPICELYDDATGLVVDISGCTEIVYSIFSENYETLLCTGNFSTDNKVAFVTDGTDGKAKFIPVTGDMDTPGRYLSTWKFTFADTKVEEVPGADIVIRTPAPTS